MCWHWKWASSSTLPYTRNYVNHKNRKNSTITKVPNFLSLSLFSAVLSGLLSGSESQNCFLSLPLCSPTKENSIPFSLCLSFCSHCVLPQLRKKTKERLETSVRDQAHSFFFFSKAFLTGNGFWVFFVYTFCLLGSDSFLLVYCCCSWKSILTKSLTKDTNFIWFVLYHWICYCFFF